MCPGQRGSEASITHLHYNVFYVIVHVPLSSIFCKCLLRRLGVCFEKTAAFQFLHVMFEYTTESIKT